MIVFPVIRLALIRSVGFKAVDFVVESDRTQLSEIVQRVRDGRLRTNIGNVSTLDDAVAALNPTERISGKTIIRVPSVSDTRLLMHAAGRRCPDRPAASYQPPPQRGSHGFHVEDQRHTP